MSGEDRSTEAPSEEGGRAFPPNPTKNGRIVAVAAFILLCCVLSLLPIDCIDKNEKSALPSERVWSWSSRQTLGGQTVWRVPLALYLARRNGVQKVTEGPHLAFEPIVQSEIPVRLAGSYQNAIKPLIDAHQPSAVARLTKSSESIDMLKRIDESAGAIDVSIAGIHVFHGTRSGPKAQTGRMSSWKSIGDSGAELEIIISQDDGPLLLRLSNDGHQTELRSIGDDQEYFTLAFEAPSTSTRASNDGGDSMGPGPGQCSCYCPGVNPSPDAPPWADEKTAAENRCGPPDNHCYRSALKFVPPEGASRFAVLVVTSPRTRSLDADTDYTNSIDFLRDVFANSFRDMKLDVLKTEALSTDEAKPWTDQGIWDRTIQYFKNPDAAPIRALQDDEERLVSSLRSQKVDKAAHVVVYVTPDRPSASMAARSELLDIDMCGQASAIGRDESHFFAVMARDCLRNPTVLAHEIGHLLGARHQIYEDSHSRADEHAYEWTVSRSAPSSADKVVSKIKAFFISQPDSSPTPERNVGDVMAVGDIQRLPHFSQLDAKCDGYFTGRNHASARFEVLQSIRTPTPPQRPSEAICESLKFESQGSLSSLPSQWTIYFTSNSADPSAGDYAVLNWLAIDQIVDAHPDAIAIAGYTDDAGAVESNLSLAFMRANSVYNELQRQFDASVGPRPQMLLCALGVFRNGPHYLPAPADPNKRKVGIRELTYDLSNRELH